MTPTEIVEGLRKRQRANRQNAEGFEPGNDAYEWWSYLENLCKEAADYIEASEKMKNKPEVVFQPHPAQPIYKDRDGVLRFKGNAIVRYLLDSGGRGLSELSKMPFSEEDWTQLRQLIGYTVSGFGEIVSEKEYHRVMGGN